MAGINAGHIERKVKHYSTIYDNNALRSHIQSCNIGIDNLPDRTQRKGIPRQGLADLTMLCPSGEFYLEDNDY